MNGEFSLKQFYQKLNIPQGERPLIEKAMAKGLEQYYHDLYGYHKYGKEPFFLIGERLGEPYIFGYAAVRILHDEDISVQTKQKVAQYTVGMNRPGQEYGVPYGALAAISCLAAGGRLRGHRLASAIRSLEGEREVFAGLTAEDTTVLTHSLLTDRELPPEERLALLYFLLARCEYAFARGKEMLEQALEASALTQEQKKTLCAWLIRGKADSRQDGLSPLESLLQGRGLDAFARPTPARLGLVPDYLKRHAIVGLARLEGDPAAVARRYLGAGGRYETVSYDQAIADIMEAFHKQMSPAEVRAMMDHGCRASEFQTRLRFYQVGLKLYGPEFIRPALGDRSAKVRNWAEKQLQKQRGK